jgi:hypothetical protein
MLTRQQFLWIYESLNRESPISQQKADFIWHFTRPYVLVIHEPTNRGYYLNRGYQVIVEVQDPPIPGKPEEGIPELLTRVVGHETTPNHQASSFTTPKWALQISSSEFTTYWMY